MRFAALLLLSASKLAAAEPADPLRMLIVIDGALARLDREEFEAMSAREAVTSKSSNVATTLNLAAVVIGSGTTAVGTALQFGNSEEVRAGYGVTICGAVIASALSIAALVRKDRAPSIQGIKTNYLAPLFDRKPESNSRLPDAVWRYLDEKRPGQTASDRAQLLERFTRDGQMSLSPHTIDLLTRPITRGEVVSASVLRTRIEMLDDLRSRVATMKLDLEGQFSE